MKYRSRLGHVFSDRDAEAIGRFLDKNFPNGQYTAQDVVNAARPKNSPIHKYFEWDIRKAAEKHWLRQAQKLITCYYVEIENVKSPAAVSVRLTSGRTYMNTEKAMGNADIWRDVLRDAVIALGYWKKRYQMLQNLKELKPVVREITTLEARHGKNKKIR